ncbi:hypothetical protein ACH3Y9_31280 [Streptomyces sp. WSLK1-5]
MTTQPPPYGQQPPPPPPGTAAPAGFGPPPPPSAFTGQPPPPPVVEGPEFMAVDRHNSVVVDSAGVAFEDHGHSAEFPWNEIRSVHYKAGPNGKTLMVAVVHLDGCFYECVVDARTRDTLGRWFAQLAPILGYYRPLA